MVLLKISFFCADVPANYEVGIERCAKSGTLGRKEIILVFLPQINVPANGFQMDRYATTV